MNAIKNQLIDYSNSIKDLREEETHKEIIDGQVDTLTETTADLTRQLQSVSKTWKGRLVSWLRVPAGRRLHNILCNLSSSYKATSERMDTLRTQRNESGGKLAERKEELQNKTIIVEGALAKVAKEKLALGNSLETMKALIGGDEVWASIPEITDEKTLERFEGSTGYPDQIQPSDFGESTAMRGVIRGNRPFISFLIPSNSGKKEVYTVFKRYTDNLRWCEAGPKNFGGLLINSDGEWCASIDAGIRGKNFGKSPREYTAESLNRFTSLIQSALNINAEAASSSK